MNGLKNLLLDLCWDMVSKYKLFFLFIFTFSLFPNENKIAILFDDMNNLDNNYKILSMYLINELEVNSPIPDFSFELIREMKKDSEFSLLDKYKTDINYSIILTATVKDNVFSINHLNEKLELISSIDIIYSYDLLEETEIAEIYINNYKDELYKNIVLLLSKIRENKTFKVQKIDKTNKINLIHNFSYFNLSLVGISYKSFYDERSNVFSVFPICLTISFYPLKYLETNIFSKFSYNNSILKFYDKEENKYYYKKTLLDIDYGFMIGYSLFYDKTHYSVGFSFYNNFFTMENEDFKKDEIYRNYILPQISIYQKIDIKIFKNIYYTFFINIRTVQKFDVYDNRIYTNVFYYDYPIIEFSLLGISVTF